MFPWISWALLLLCASDEFFGGLGLTTTPEKEELWETWMRLVLDKTPVVQLLEDITHQTGNVSSPGATELRERHLVFPSNRHQEQARTRDVYPQRDSDLVLHEVMEKLQRVNQSLQLMLEALEAARSRLENHLEHLNAIPNPDGQSPSATSTFIPHGSYFVLLVLLLVPTPLRAILLLLLFLASSTLSILEFFTLLVFAVAGQWLVASICRGARGIRRVVSQEKPWNRLTSTPKRECDMELLQEELDRMEMSCVREPSDSEELQEVAGDIPSFTGWVSPVPGGRRTTLRSCGAIPESVMDPGKRWEPTSRSRRDNMSLSSPRSLCQGFTRAGQRCRKKPIPRQDFCHIHATSSSLAMDSSPCF